MTKSGEGDERNLTWCAKVLHPPGQPASNRLPDDEVGEGLPSVHDHVVRPVLAVLGPPPAAQVQHLLQAPTAR
jgi:hypothetical protein